MEEEENTRVLDPDFDFLTWLELTEMIYNKSNTLSDLFSSLAFSIIQTQEPSSEHDDKIIRDLILEMINSHHQRTKSFDFIEHMHHRLQPHPSTKRLPQIPDSSTGGASTFSDISLDIAQKSPSPQIVPTPENAHLVHLDPDDPFHFCTYAFSIASLLCRTYHYLDLISVLTCGLVCKNWLEKTYDHASFYKFDIRDIMPVKEIPRPQNDNFGIPDFRYRLNFCNLERFQNARHLYLTNWPEEYSDCFSILSAKFKRVESVDIRQSRMDTFNMDLDKVFGHIVVQMLRHNQNTIRSIRLVVESDNFDETKRPMLKIINSIAESIHFPHLERLEMEGLDDAMIMKPDLAPINLTHLCWRTLFCSNEATQRYLANTNVLKTITHFECTQTSVEEDLNVSKVLNQMPNLQSLQLDETKCEDSSADLVFNMALSPNCASLQTLTIAINWDWNYKISFQEFLAKTDYSQRYYFSNLTKIDIKQTPGNPRECKAQLHNFLSCFRPAGTAEENIYLGSEDLDGLDSAAASAVSASAGTSGMNSYKGTNIKFMKLETCTDIGRVSDAIAKSGGLVMENMERMEICYERGGDYSKPSMMKCVDMINSANTNLIAKGKNCIFDFRKAIRGIGNRGDSSMKARMGEMANVMLDILSRWGDNVMCQIDFLNAATGDRRKFIDAVMDRLAKDSQTGSLKRLTVNIMEDLDIVEMKFNMPNQTL